MPRNTQGLLPPTVREALRIAGFIFERRNKHIIYRHAQTRQIVVLSGSPGDGQRAERNMLADIRKATLGAKPRYQK